MASWSFVCNDETRPECFRRRLFGCGQNISVTEGDRLFLYDYSQGDVYGPFRATGDLKRDIEPEAWSGEYSYQVPVTWDPDGLYGIDADEVPGFKQLTYDIDPEIEDELAQTLVTEGTRILVDPGTGDVLRAERLVAASDLQASLRTILDGYGDARVNNDWDHETIDEVKTTAPTAIRRLLDSKRRGLKVNHATFVGRLANVPWVSVRDPAAAESAQHGLYVVYLFDTAADELRLTLNQGVKHLRDEYSLDTARRVLEKRADILRRWLDIDGFANERIELSEELVTNRNELFQHGTVCHRTYELDDFPGAEAVAADLLKIVHVYETLVNDEVYQRLRDDFDESSGVQGDPFESIPGEDDEGEDTGDDTSGGDSEPSGPVIPRDRLESLLEDEERQAHLFREAFAHLVAGKNVVFYGPPGTGKTRAARLLTSVVCDSTDDIVTANAEWTNYEVVGGWAPGEDDWAASPGFLTEATRACIEGLEDTADPRPNWLIIDELNRANLDQAFGEVFTLLDLAYRDTETLEFAQQTVPVPLSFRILATMNTYDQAQLFALGYAFRRRFAFVEVPPLLDGERTESGTTTDGSAAKWLDPDREWLVELVRDTAVDELVGANTEGVVKGDVPAIYPAFSDINQVRLAIDELNKDDSIGAGGLGFVGTIVVFAREVAAEDVIDIGQGLLIDAAKFVIAHQLLFPEETSHETVDMAITAYLVPQFDNFMPELRRAETIDSNSDAEARFERVIDLAATLGLNRTAKVLRRASREKEVLG
jgi:hypothetical protein